MGSGEFKFSFFVSACTAGASALLGAVKNLKIETDWLRKSCGKASTNLTSPSESRNSQPRNTMITTTGYQNTAFRLRIRSFRCHQQNPTPTPTPTISCRVTFRMHMHHAEELWCRRLVSRSPVEISPTSTACGRYRKWSKRW
jgi:hypothetical protein